MIEITAEDPSFLPKQGFRKKRVKFPSEWIPAMAGILCSLIAFSSIAQTSTSESILKQFNNCCSFTSNCKLMDECGYVYDDWITCSENLKACGTLCQGYYLEQPLPPGITSSSYPDTQPITITAAQGEFSGAEESASTLSGQVHMINGYRQLFADKSFVYKSKGAIDRLTAKGHVKMTEPGFRVDGDSANVYVDSGFKRLDIDNAHYRVYGRHGRGEADNVLVQDDKMDLNNVTYTTCAPCQNTWSLKASHVRLNKTTGRGRARHAQLKVYDIPIFYTPYLDFPIDDRRQTGFLFPSFNVTNRSGVELSTPFYWNIAPNYDAMITPRAYSKRGLELQGQFRYLLPNSFGELEGSFLPDDNAYRKFRHQKLENHAPFPNNDPRVTALNTNNNREAFRMVHSTNFNENLSANLSYQAVHDDNYFMDFGSNIGIASTTQLLQMGQVLYKDPNWGVQARLQQYQTLHPYTGPTTFEVYRRLPQVALQNTYDLPCNFQWDLKSEFSRFTHQHNPFTGEAFTTGDRVWLRPSISMPLYNPGWYVKPRIQWNFLSYSLNLSPFDTIQKRPEHPTLSLPMFDIDSGLIFERPLCICDSSFIQTLEPRAYYLYVPFKKQNDFPNFDTTYPGFDFNQLYRDNRFAGLDRLGDANQLTLGITTRLLEESTGQERLNITLGQIVYFEKRRINTALPLNSGGFPLQVRRPKGLTKSELRRGHASLENHRQLSPLVGLARYKLMQNWWISGNAEWDFENRELDKAALYFQYTPDEFTVLNLGYQYLRRDIAEFNPLTRHFEQTNQTEVSFAWALNENWRMLGRWHYDLHNRRSNEISLGIEQQGCCTAVRLFATRFLEPYDILQPNLGRSRYSNAIFIQFVFKGFAGVGNNKIEPVLKRAIPGYRWRSDQF